MILNLLTILLVIIIFLKLPIRFSEKKIIYKLNYNLLSKYVLFIIIAIELYQLHISSLKKYSNYLVILPAIICYIIIDIIHKPPVIDDGSFNPPPKYSSKSNLLYIIALIILIFNWLKQNNKIVASLNIILLIVIYMVHAKFAPCKYNLPKSWSTKL
jgi:hypothetical protein